MSWWNSLSGKATCPTGSPSAPRLDDPSSSACRLPRHRATATPASFFGRRKFDGVIRMRRICPGGTADRLSSTCSPSPVRSPAACRGWHADVQGQPALGALASELSRSRGSSYLCYAFAISTSKRRWTHHALAVTRNGDAVRPDHADAFKFCAVGALERAASDLGHSRWTINPAAPWPRGLQNSCAEDSGHSWTSTTTKTATPQSSPSSTKPWQHNGPTLFPPHPDGASPAPFLFAPPCRTAASSTAQYRARSLTRPPKFVIHHASKMREQNFQNPCTMTFERKSTTSPAIAGKSTMRSSGSPPTKSTWAPTKNS
jgi:hypothetical protein